MRFLPCSCSLALLPLLIPAAHAETCPLVNGAYSATATSSGGRYTAQFASARLALNQATSVSFRITKADGSRLVPQATVQLRLLMIAHGHGMTTRPVIMRGDDDTFRADGILLHMAGEWTIFLDVDEGPVAEKIETCLTI